jgi:GT2 family glycosyltransferase
MGALLRNEDVMSKHNALHFDFRSLPDALLDGLLIGGVGKQHLLRLGDACLRLAAPLELSTALLVGAWQADLLDGGHARQALGLAGRSLAPGIAAVAKAVAESWRAPSAPHPFYEVALSGEQDALQAFYERQFEAEPENCFWLQQAFGLAVFERRFEWILRVLDGVASRLPEPFAPLLAKMRGDVAFLEGDFSAAANHFGQALRRLPLAAVQARLAQTLFLRGRSEAGLDFLKLAVRAQPWNANLLLRLYEYLDDAQPKPLEGRLAVLLYTYNRSEDLALTLERLWDTGAIRPPRVRICALDNGSSDASAATLAAWRERFGDGLEVLTLPVNIGAPAARNWLARHAGLADCEWLLYLDDDALPPDDWLDLLAQAVERYPDASVWGCRVLDAYNPAVLQHVDLHLTDPSEPAFRDPIAPVYPPRFGVSQLHHQDLDFGQFDYLRPCVSVTGCCHLFRRAALLEQPPFDLRFSPSQFDDAEHDLALASAGGYAAYQGRLPVLHRRRSGRQSRLAEPERARAFGNQYKMHLKYSPERIAAIRAGSRQRLLADLEIKVRRLREAGVLK